MIVFERILVVAAHPDDETLGAGGTIARWSDEGRQVAVSFLTDGVGARGDAGGLEAASVRRTAATRAGEVLGVGELRFGDLPDNQLDQVPMLRVAQHVEGLIEEFQSELVLTHHPGDLNVDHRIAAEAVATACRPQPGNPVRLTGCSKSRHARTGACQVRPVRSFPTCPWVCRCSRTRSIMR